MVLADWILRTMASIATTDVSPAVDNRLPVSVTQQKGPLEPLYFDLSERAYLSQSVMQRLIGASLQRLAGPRVPMH